MEQAKHEINGERIAQVERLTEKLRRKRMEEAVDSELQRKQRRLMSRYEVMDYVLSKNRELYDRLSR